jgi:polyhydroxybutyrate depolymerase
VVDGETRTYQLALPADLSAPAPVILDLHGLGESAAEQVAYSGLSRQGPAAGMVVATPASDDAINSWTVSALGNKDADFMAALLNQLEATRCIDTSREVAAGISNGAGLSDSLICALNGRLAAIFPVSGINLVKPCTTAKPTTIVAFHGTSDPIVPYGGGGLFSGVPGGLAGAAATSALSPGVKALFARLQLQPVESAIAGWARQFGCGPPTDASVAGDVRLRSFGGCQGNVTVELYTITGGGHTWPGAALGPSKSQLLGATTHSISATQLIVAAVGSLATRA